MLPVFRKVVPLVAPQPVIGFTRDGGLDEQDEGAREIVHVDVVPAGFAGSNDGGFAALESEFGEFVDLAAAGEGGASAVACGEGG